MRRAREQGRRKGRDGGGEREKEANLQSAVLSLTFQNW